MSLGRVFAQCNHFFMFFFSKVQVFCKVSKKKGKSIHINWCHSFLREELNQSKLKNETRRKEIENKIKTVKKLEEERLQRLRNNYEKKHQVRKFYFNSVFDLSITLMVFR